MTWTQLSTLIVAKCQTSGLVQSTSVFDYEKATFDNYPAITVTPSDNTADFADTSRNYIYYTFSIKCYMERLETTAEVAESTLRALVDDLIQKFNADPTLGGQLVSGYSKPIPSVWGYRQGDEPLDRVAEIKYLTYFVQ